MANSKSFLIKNTFPDHAGKVNSSSFLLITFFFLPPHHHTCNSLTDYYVIIFYIFTRILPIGS